MGTKFDPSRVDALVAKARASSGETATYAISEFKSVIQAEVARNSRQDALQKLIIEIVSQKNSRISRRQLEIELRKRIGQGVIPRIYRR